MVRERKQTPFYSVSHGMNFEKCSKFKLKVKNRDYKTKSRLTRKLKLKVKLKMPSKAGKSVKKNGKQKKK